MKFPSRLCRQGGVSEERKYTNLKSLSHGVDVADGLERGVETEPGGAPLHHHLLEWLLKLRQEKKSVGRLPRERFLKGTAAKMMQKVLRGLEPP